MFLLIWLFGIRPVFVCGCWLHVVVIVALSRFVDGQPQTAPSSPGLVKYFEIRERQFIRKETAAPVTAVTKNPLHR